MNGLIIIISLLAVAILLCVSSVVMGRNRSTRPRQVAFYAGLTGVFASLIWPASFFGIALQIPYLRLDTAFGMLFLSSFVILLCACLMSLLALLTIHSERRKAN